MSVTAIIVAAGRGLRAGGPVPKQYAHIANQRMLTISINAILKSMKIDYVIVVINKNDLELYLDCIKNIHDKRLLHYCFGGQERSDSVRNGLKSLKPYNPKKVLIHDAARPYISTDLIEVIINKLTTSDAVLPIIPIFDALWEIGDTSFENKIIKPGPDRSRLFRAQTPQGFNYKKIYKAHQQVNKSALDDIAIAFEAGLKISSVPGEEINCKLTTAEQVNRVKG